MEVLSIGETCLKPLILNDKSSFKFPLSRITTGFFVRKLEFVCFGRNPENCGKNPCFSIKAVNDKQQETQVDEWKLEFLGKRGNLSSKLPEKKKQEKSRLLGDTDSMDWCVRARKVALKSIEDRGMTRVMENMVSRKAKKKNKKNKKDKGLVDKKVKLDGDDFDFDSDSDFDDEIEDISSLDNMDHLRKAVGMLGDGMFEQKKKETMETFVQRLSQFSNQPSDKKKEVNLNRMIVDSQTAEEVLEVISDMIVSVGKGLSPSPLSPLNLATAIHRIAKNMEKVSMMESRRLVFARQREMSMLVGIAMSSLPECSAQGISNIAWGLSKIGGDLLYMTEMDRISEIAMTKIDEFSSQNVANVAGAFASMRHSSPDLFGKLCMRGSKIVHSFRPQEIAQLLWAFALLNERADPLLEALDTGFKDEQQFQCYSRKGSLSYDEFEVMDSENVGPVILKFNRDQLGNIAWSYAVLGEMNRTFFSNVWKTLQNFEEERITDQYREDVMFASQVYLANQCLKVEYSNLQLSLKVDVEEKIARAGKTRRFNQKVTSSFQKEVARLLYSTGLEFVREYALDAYTLDAALIDKKVALEIDGPTHFSRNSGSPLGHTVLKRRYVAACGWDIVSVSHQEWQELQGSVEQEGYLRQLLKDYVG